MAISNQEVTKYAAIAFILAIMVSAYFIIKPLFLAIIGGLLLAYICAPVYRFLFKIFREKNTSALATSIVVILIVFIPFWFLVPLMIEQLFNIFTVSQTLNIAGVIEKIIPSFSDQIKRDVATAVITFISKTTASSIGALTTFILDLPTYLLYLAVISFVFFFALRDADKFKEYVKSISPLKKEKERLLATQFKEITSSIIFGYIIVGILQGIATGIGLIVFGVPNALLLTVFALFASIIPLIGPGLVWLPVSIYLISIGNVGAGIGFLIYGALFVSTLDNFIRPYLISRRTNVPTVVILIGMIGGIFVFGLLGIIIGPLILAYVLTIMDAYRNKTLAEMFNAD